VKKNTLLLIASLIVVSSCSPTTSYATPSDPVKKTIRDYTTPTKKLKLSQYPKFIDDLNFDLMDIAINRQIKRFKQKSMRGTIKLGSDTYPQSHMMTSLIEFRKLLSNHKSCLLEKSSKSACLSQIDLEIRTKFNVYAPKLTKKDPRSNRIKNALFTAYNTPTLKVSRTKTSYYKYGIYKMPTNKGQKMSTRSQIDFKRVLESTRFNMFYAHDLFELYLLHIEGGGKVEIQEKNGSITEHYLSFAGTNGRKFRWISTYMVKEGMLDPDHRSIEDQRVYLAAHPEREEEIYSTCPNYIYFKITEHPPLGSDDTPLTDNRSIATDSKLYRAKGLLAFVIARRPIEGQSLKTRRSALKFREFSRFFLDQDTGGAIKGKARADLYFGEGPYSQLAGENITELGQIFFLIKKK
jgi:membrane-bound lytic murein transglycosylase A